MNRDNFIDDYEGMKSEIESLKGRVNELEEIIVGINSCRLVGITWPNELKKRVEKIWEES